MLSVLFQSQLPFWTLGAVEVLCSNPRLRGGCRFAMRIAECLTAFKIFSSAQTRRANQVQFSADWRRCDKLRTDGSIWTDMDRYSNDEPLNWRAIWEVKLWLWMCFCEWDKQLWKAQSQIASLSAWSWQFWKHFLCRRGHFGLCSSWKLTSNTTAGVRRVRLVLQIGAQGMLSTGNMNRIDRKSGHVGIIIRFDSHP